jgi:hypothetical protein
MTYDADSSTRLDDRDRDNHDDTPRDADTRLDEQEGEAAEPGDQVTRDDTYQAADADAGDTELDAAARRDATDTVDDTELDAAARRDATDTVDDTDANDTDPDETVHGRHELDTYGDGGATDQDAVDAVNADAGTVYHSGNDTDENRADEKEADEHRTDDGPIDAAGADVADAAPAVQQEMKPGSVQPAAVAAFWVDADAQGIRARWQELQLRFIDDPQSVAGEAEAVVEEAVASLTAALTKARQDLGGWRDGSGDDTERLRAAVRDYRDFLNRLLAL